jgi:hypothetical protein
MVTTRGWEADPQGLAIRLSSGSNRAQKQLAAFVHLRSAVTVSARRSIVHETNQLNWARRLTVVCLAIGSLPAAFSQASDTFVNSPTSTTATQPADKMDLIDKVLGMVGPAEPTTLTQKDRFQMYLLSVGGPVPLLGEAAGAGISQWKNAPPEWGQGWGAYGERYGSNLAYNGIRQTITYGASIALHEDTRYFASGKHGVWARTGYAILSTFTARHPNGRQSFSYSNVGGVIGASGIASIWGPRSWQGFNNIAENAGISFGATAALNVVREFLPDLLHRPRPENSSGH